MARTTEDLIQLQLGAQAIAIARLQAQVEKLTDENQQLKATVSARDQGPRPVERVS